MCTCNNFQAQINEKVASLKEEISKLDGMIVHNPDRMKADMDKMQHDIEQLKVSEHNFYLFSYLSSDNPACSI